MILNEFDEVLTSQRLKPDSFYHENWQFPGGYMEFGETFVEAIVRETFEETGA